MGEHGADALLAAAAKGRKLRVLTHCNTGSLATAAYGTALGVIRSLHVRGQLEHAYCTETRPYNQGEHTNKESESESLLTPERGSQQQACTLA